MIAPVSIVKVEQGDAGVNGIYIWATVERYGRATHTYRISQASARRLSRATHDRYISRWPLCGRTGWRANLYISQETLSNYYRGLVAEWKARNAN